MVLLEVFLALLLPNLHAYHLIGLLFQELVLPVRRVSECLDVLVPIWFWKQWPPLTSVWMGRWLWALVGVGSALPAVTPLPLVPAVG